MARWNFRAAVRTAEPSVHSAYGEAARPAMVEAQPARVERRRMPVQSMFLQPLDQPRGWRATFLDH
jgi:hypothetical protein